MKKTLRSLTALFLALLMLAGCSTSPAHEVVTQARKQLLTDNEASSVSSSDSAAPPSVSPTSAPTAAAEPSPEPTPEPEPQALTDGVTLGRSVFIHDNGVAFWGAEEVLCSALVDSQGNLYDFCAEGTPNSYIWCNAIIGTDYYMATSDGFFRFDLADLEQGNTSSELLSEDCALHGFSIYGDTIYYMRKEGLFTIPTDGGDPQLILSGIQDYEVTNRGIFYTDGTNSLHLLDPATGNTVKVTDCSANCDMSLYGDSILLWTGQEVYLYCDPTGETRSISLPMSSDSVSHMWLGDGCFLYETEDDDIYRYDLETGQQTMLDRFHYLPDKGEGLLRDGVLYYSLARNVRWKNIFTGESGSVDLEDFLPDSAAAAPTSTPAPASVPSTFSMGNHLVSVEYDDCFDVVNDYFMITMPKSPAWAAELVDDNTLTFYYIPGRDAGYDGTFLTIKALPLSEEASLDYPAYAIAGRDSQKLYVALFATDLRFDNTDPTQQSEYNTLRDYVLQISEGSVNSPFQIAR